MIFLLILGYVFLILCMACNFLLYGRHGDFYLLCAGYILLSLQIFLSLFWNTVKLLRNRLTFWGSFFQDLLGKARAVLRLRLVILLQKQDSCIQGTRGPVNHEAPSLAGNGDSPGPGCGWDAVPANPLGFFSACSSSHPCAHPGSAEHSFPCSLCTTPPPVLILQALATSVCPISPLREGARGPKYPLPLPPPGRALRTAGHSLGSPVCPHPSGIAVLCFLTSGVLRLYFVWFPGCFRLEGKSDPCDSILATAGSTALGFFPRNISGLVVPAASLSYF